MRLYTINSYGDDFYAGRLADGRQMLIGLLCPELVAVVFDADGRLLRVHSRALSQLPPRQGVIGVSWETDAGVQSMDGLRPGPYQIYDPRFQAVALRDLESWKREARFEESPITVRDFFLEDRFLGIRQLPDHLQEFQENPEDFSEDEEERRYFEESVREWESQGRFVLWWGKDYYVSRDGDVEST